MICAPFTNSSESVLIMEEESDSDANTYQRCRFTGVVFWCRFRPEKACNYLNPA